jgi:translation initiation factor 1 (eIF-1/SUI1)
MDDEQYTAVGKDGFIHIRLQKRNKKKGVTTVTGLARNVDFGVILSTLKDVSIVLLLVKQI